MASRTSVQHTSESAPSGTPDGALDRCLNALARRPSALITDIDGTISRIVPRPEDATVDPSVGRALEALTATLDLVAVLTARDAGTARRMVRADYVLYVGNYGLVPGAAVDGLDGIARARAEVGPLLADLPCVTVEDKGVAFSLHYRNCDEPDAVRLRLLDLAAPLATAAGARILEGKRVIELVPASLPDKRSAFLTLMDRRHLKGLVYLGDDLSDIPVYSEIAARRDSGALDAVAIAVADAETDPAVLAAADMALNGVDEVEELLRHLAERLGRTGG